VSVSANAFAMGRHDWDAFLGSLGFVFAWPRRQMKITTAAAMSGVKTIIRPAQNMLNESTSSFIVSGCRIIGGGTG
jgi:hypothetical protein